MKEGATPDTDATPGVQITAAGNLKRLNSVDSLPTDGAPVAPADKAPPVLVKAQYNDTCGLGVGAGDTVTLTFSEPVATNNVNILDIGLPVTGDSWDTSTVGNQTLTPPSKTATITLGGNPQLTPGGTYAPGVTNPGSPTGVYIDIGTGITDAVGNVALNLPVSTAVDLLPGGVIVAIVWADNFGIDPRILDFGTSDLETTSQSSTCSGTLINPNLFNPNGVIVRNSGNVCEKFTLTCSNAAPDGWTLAATAGLNQFEMKVDKTDTGPPFTQYTLDLTAGPQVIAPPPPPPVLPLYSGQNKMFDLQFMTPTDVLNGAGVQQKITLTITATQD